MKIAEFVQGFKDNRVINTHMSPNAVSEYIQNTLEVKKYVPFVEKRELCANVLNSCNKKDSNGLVKVDSVSRYILFTIAVITKYTNIEFSSGEDDDIDSLDEYDMLCQADLLNPILDVIGEEYVTCNNILNMMMSDIVANNNTVENAVGHTLGRVSKSIDGLIYVLREKVEDMELDLNQIDIDKFKGLFELLPKK